MAEMVSVSVRELAICIAAMAQGNQWMLVSRLPSCASGSGRALHNRLPSLGYGTHAEGLAHRKCVAD